MTVVPRSADPVPMTEQQKLVDAARVGLGLAMAYEEDPGRRHALK